MASEAHFALGRDTQDLDDLRWYFTERDGSLGLKAQSYEPRGTTSPEEQASRMADEIIEKRLAHVERERRVSRALELLKREKDGVMHVRVLRRYVSPSARFVIPEWCRLVFADLASLSVMTPTALSYKANGWLDELAQKKGSLTKAKIKAEAHAMLTAALRAYGQCKPKRKK